MKEHLSVSAVAVQRPIRPAPLDNTAGGPPRLPTFLARFVHIITLHLRHRTPDAGAVWGVKQKSLNLLGKTGRIHRREASVFGGLCTLRRDFVKGAVSRLLIRPLIRGV